MYPSVKAGGADHGGAEVVMGKPVDNGAGGDEDAAQVALAASLHPQLYPELSSLNNHGVARALPLTEGLLRHKRAEVEEEKRKLLEEARSRGMAAAVEAGLLTSDSAGLGATGATAGSGSEGGGATSVPVTGGSSDGGAGYAAPAYYGAPGGAGSGGSVVALAPHEAPPPGAVPLVPGAAPGGYYGDVGGYGGAQAPLGGTVVALRPGQAPPAGAVPLPAAAAPVPRAHGHAAPHSPTPPTKAPSSHQHYPAVSDGHAAAARAWFLRCSFSSVAAAQRRA